MKNIPVNLTGFKLMVSEEPTVKMKKNKAGVEEVATVYNTNDPLYVVGLFAKPKEAGESGRRAKGEEIKVTVSIDPGELPEGTFVELSAPTVSPFDFTNDSGEKVAGISFKANAISAIG